MKCGERVLDRIGHKREQGPAIHRYLGLSLGGAKSDRTCLTVIDYYNEHDKSFIVDVYESVAAEGDQTADVVLLELVDELSKEISPMGDEGIRAIGVDAPLTLPPCLLGCDAPCGGYDKCKKPEVRWMRNQYLKAKAKNPKLKHFTPYSQRPVDLYFRYKLNEASLFQDETMGANLAPQAVRMNYLKRHLAKTNLVEVWPKLALYHVQKALRLTRRDVLEYRHLERGVHIRERIVERLAERSQIFVYERDMKKFIANMDAFDSLICAWVAMQSDLGLSVKFKSDLPLESGWVQIPQL